jgi:hypothetical protein
MLPSIEWYSSNVQNYRGTTSSNFAQTFVWISFKCDSTAKLFIRNCETDLLLLLRIGRIYRAGKKEEKE